MTLRGGNDDSERDPAMWGSPPRHIDVRSSHADWRRSRRAAKVVGRRSLFAHINQDDSGRDAPNHTAVGARKAR